MNTKIRQTKRYGWKKDIPDQRDFKFKLEKPFNLKDVSLFTTGNTPPVYDQGDLGSCTGNATAAITEFALMNKSTTPAPNADLYMPSRLEIYYYARVIEGTASYDSGAQIRDCIKVVANKGVCDENKWPYDISKFAHKPSSDCMKEANKFKSLVYYKINNTDKHAIVGALLAGHPVAFGFTVYESFESDVVSQTGIVPMPGVDEQVLGGHAVTIWGYSLVGDYFIVRNSWGPNWGINGYCHMPAAYLTNPELASDFWVITNMA